MNNQRKRVPVMRVERFSITKKKRLVRKIARCAEDAAKNLSQKAE